MGKICILTDSTAQFTKPNYPGQSYVKIIPLDVYLNDHLCTPEQENGEKFPELPFSAGELLKPQLIAPSSERFRQTFTDLCKEYEEVLGIFLSSQLNLCFANAQKSVAALGLKERVKLIDSQTTSTGLGYIVQSAAALLEKDASMTDLERVVFDLITRIYMVLCIPGLSYLYYNNFLDYAQAHIGEMLNLYSIFTLEDGRLAPLEKMKNQRQIVEYYQEFLSEFDYLDFVALMQSSPPAAVMGRFLRDYLKNSFPNIPYNENKLNFPLSVLFGPRSTGIILIESPG
jgi:DegV family protein with EDD domain